MPAQADVLLGVAEFLALGESQLFTNDVDAADCFAHGMLDLQSRVHLQEVKVAGLVVNQELNRPG